MSDSKLLTDEDRDQARIMSSQLLETRAAAIESPGVPLDVPIDQLLTELRATGDLWKAIRLMIPGHAAYFGRYATRNYKEKLALGKYVLDRWLTDGRRAFLHASTTTLPIGAALAQASPRSVEIVTNSAVLPIVALREDGKHQVRTVTGPYFDAFCGGWDLPIDDADEMGRFRNLFVKNGGKLNTAIFAPMAIKPKSGPYFIRHETAYLAKIALQAADEVVLIAPSDRVYLQKDPVFTRALIPAFDDAEWTEQIGKKAVLVVAGAPRDKSTATDIITNRYLEDCGIKITWISTDLNTTRWADTIIDDVVKQVGFPLHSNQIRSGHRAEVAEFCNEALSNPDEFMDWIFSSARIVLSRRKHSQRIQLLMQQLLELVRFDAAYSCGQTVGSQGRASSKEASEFLGISRAFVHKKCTEYFGLPTKAFQADGVTIPKLVLQSKSLVKTAFALWALSRPQGVKRMANAALARKRHRTANKPKRLRRSAHQGTSSRPSRADATH
jgi:hypothetical protein